MATAALRKHRAIAPANAPSRAKCSSPDCWLEDYHCPRHRPALYARVEAKHRHDTELVLPGPTLAEGLDALREAVAAQIVRAS